MKKRRTLWSRQHAIGLAIGVLTTIIAIPLVAYILHEFRGDIMIWRELRIFHSTQAKVLSLATIPNLLWFHTFLKKEQYWFGSGIIYSTLLNLVTVIVLKYFL